MVRRTSAEAAEFGLLLIFILFRFATLLQVDVGAAFGADAAKDTLRYLLSCAVVNAYSILLAWVCWKQRRVALRWLGVGDVALCIGVLILQAYELGPQWMLGSWVGWAPGLATCVAASTGIWSTSLPLMVVATSLICGTYMISLTAIGVTHLPSIAINGGMYVVFSLFLYVLARYWRQLADRADAAQAEALQATKSAELDRYRLLVHDPATILRMLGDPKTPEQLLPTLRAQALAEASRMRTYLDGRREVPATGESCASLETLTLSAISNFPDLPIESSTLLARDVCLTESDALAIQRALTTLLHNVRLHAQARHVIIHADALGDEWELSVSDDGIGFAPETSEVGYGLGEQVVESMNRIGARVDIVSAPGEGTRVTLTGPWVARTAEGAHQHHSGEKHQ